MGIPLLPTQHEENTIPQNIVQLKLIIPNNNIATPEVESGLNELLSNFLKGGIAFENVYRARELHKELASKISKFGGIERLGDIRESKQFSDLLRILDKITKNNDNLINKPISISDAETLTKLIIKLEALEEQALAVKQEKAKVSSHLDLVLNGITDRIIMILINEAMARGSYINLAISIARLNPIWDVPDEYDLTQYLKKQVLTEDFRTCLKESVKGNKVRTDKLNPLQKKFFSLANYIIRLLCIMPEFLIKWLPRTGKVTKLCVNIVHQTPVFGPLITSFIGPIDEIINMVRVYGEQIKYIRKVAKEAREQHKK